MRKLIQGAATVLAAVLVFLALRQISLPLMIGVNVFTVAVIVYGASEGELAGALAGAACGLIVDSFSLGLFGLAGLSKTVTGYLAGFISRKINVQPPARMFIFAGILGAVDLGLWVLLATVIAAEGFPWAGGWLLVQPVGTAVLVMAVTLALRRIKVRRAR